MTKPPVLEPARPGEERLLALLARAGQASRADLARDLALPKATVADLVARLLDQGRIVAGAAPADRQGRGRPAQSLALAGPPPAVAVITWSAGQLGCGLVTLSGQVLAEGVLVRELATEAPPSGQAVAGLRSLAAAAGYPVDALAAVVLSVPAPYQRGVGTALTVPAADAGGPRRAGWAGHELADDLATQAGATVLVENDANLGALGEHAFGAGVGHPDQVYVKFGQASVGAGLIIGGRLHRGARGFAGELAHVQVADGGPVCACGGRGCLIRTINTQMIELAQPAYEQPLTYRAVLGLAEAGDIGMQRLLGDFGRAIGRPLADACTLLNPDLLVLDSSIGPAARYILAGLREAIELHACPLMSATAGVVPGALGHRAELLGAVVLAGQETARR